MHMTNKIYHICKWIIQNDPLRINYKSTKYRVKKVVTEVKRDGRILLSKKKSLINIHLQYISFIYCYNVFTVKYLNMHTRCYEFICWKTVFHRMSTRAPSAIIISKLYPKRLIEKSAFFSRH